MKKLLISTLFMTFVMLCFIGTQSAIASEKVLAPWATDEEISSGYCCADAPVCKFQPLPALNYCPIKPPVKIAEKDNYGFPIEKGQSLVNGSFPLWIRTGTFADIWDNQGMHKRVYGPGYAGDVNEYVLFQKCEKI